MMPIKDGLFMGKQTMLTQWVDMNHPHDPQSDIEFDKASYIFPDKTTYEQKSALFILAQNRSYRRHGRAAQKWPSCARYASFLALYVLPRQERIRKARALRLYQEDILRISQIVEEIHEHR